MLRGVRDDDIPSHLISFLGLLPQPWGRGQKRTVSVLACFDASRQCETRILGTQARGLSGRLRSEGSQEGEAELLLFWYPQNESEMPDSLWNTPTVHLQFWDYKIIKFPFTGCHCVDFLPCYQAALLDSNYVTWSQSKSSDHPIREVTDTHSDRMLLDHPV